MKIRQMDCIVSYDKDPNDKLWDINIIVPSLISGNFMACAFLGSYNTLPRAMGTMAIIADKWKLNVVQTCI